MAKFNISLLVAFGSLFLSVSGALASPIISVTGSAAGSFSLGGNSQQVLEASWTTSQAYSNVSIAAEVGNGASTGLDAYLTTAIGPSETIADQIASLLNFNPSTDNEVDILFSGLALGPGTYHLVLTDTDSINPDIWWGTSLAGNGSGATVTTGPGVTFGADGHANAPSVNNANPAASPFGTGNNIGLLFQVTGDPTSSAPEPGSLSLILVGASGVWFWKRRRSA